MLISRFTFATVPKSSAAEPGMKKGTTRRRQRARAKARITCDEKAGSSYTYRGRYRGNHGNVGSIGGTAARARRAEGTRQGPPPAASDSPARRSEPEDFEAGRGSSDPP